MKERARKRESSVVARGRWHFSLCVNGETGEGESARREKQNVVARHESEDAVVVSTSSLFLAAQPAPCETGLKTSGLHSLNTPTHLLALDSFD